MLYSRCNTDEQLGYWPESLFTSWRDSATDILYGGVVIFHKNDLSPPMGTFHFPNEESKKVAYIRNIQFKLDDGWRLL